MNSQRPDYKVIVQNLSDIEESLLEEFERLLDEPKDINNLTQEEMKIIKEKNERK